MAYWRAAALMVVLAGCESVPSPTEPVPEGNAQIRLLEIQGEASPLAQWLTIGGPAAKGHGCSATFLGRLPPGVTATFAIDRCSIHVQSDTVEEYNY